MDILWYLFFALTGVAVAAALWTIFFGKETCSAGGDHHWQEVRDDRDQKVNYYCKKCLQYRYPIAD